MSDPDRDLDARLEALAAHVGGLPGFERAVADTVRRAGCEARPDRPALERLVGASIQGAVRATRARRSRRWLWSGAAAASLLAVVAAFWILGPDRPVLASIEPDSTGYEVRTAGEEHWRRPPGRVRLGPGDEVRSVVHHTVSVRLEDGGHIMLHPESRFRIDSRTTSTRKRLVQAQLVYGGVDVERARAGPAVLVLRAGDAECRVDGARVQARRRPERGVVFTAYRGQASLRTPEEQRQMKPGTVLFVTADRTPRSRVTAFPLDNRALVRLLSGMRQRWTWYVEREARRQATGHVTVSVRLSPLARQLTGARDRSPSRKPWAWVQQVPFPGQRVTDIREKARRFLAVHTEDDHRFVVDSLAEALRIGLPEIAGQAVASLAMMGEDPDTIVHRIETAARSRTGEGPRFARLAALAAAGQGNPTEVIRAALTPSHALRIRALAVLAVAGIGDPSLVKEVFFLAQGSVGDLYHDWRASADFCSAVGLVLAGSFEGVGRAYARDLVRDPSLPVKARRRYLSGLARSLHDRPESLHGFLLETFPCLTEAKLRRAVVMELLHARPVHPDAEVADFFRDLAEQRGALCRLALNGLARYAPASRRRAVEAWLRQLLERDPEAAMRAAAAQAFAPTGARRARGSARVVSALEKALGDRDADVRFWAARTLAVVGRRATLPVVMEAARTEADPRCLAALAYTAARLPGAARDPEIARFLARRAGENLPVSTRTAFVQALGVLGTDFSRLILEDLSTLAEDPEIRMAAVEALATLRAGPAGSR